MRPRLLLAGPPGSGKSTVGAALGRLRGEQAVDVDELISKREGRTPAELIRTEGESRFREIEMATLANIEPSVGVISLGGGALTTLGGLEACRAAGVLVGLTAPPTVLSERLRASGVDRPLLAETSAESVARLTEARRWSYAAVDVEVASADGAERVAREIEARTEEVALLEARVSDSRSRVLVGRGLTSAIRGAVAALRPTRPVLCVLDENLPRARRSEVVAAIAALFPVVEVVLPGGEAVKTWEVLGRVLERALAAGCGRQSVVLGLGGGAVTDLAGMVASLLGRGAPLVLAPTTLLAQVDASVGGKCAVNMGAGRNLVGAFHAAATVVADVDLLESLPAAEYRSGLAELLKIAVIGDPGLFARLESERHADARMIARAVELKAEIVARDPFEKGERRLLNLGHTLGHALESASGYTLRHGEAVAIGLAAVARYSAERFDLDRGERDRILGALSSLGLPTSAPRDLLARAEAYLGADKKGSAQGVELIVVRAIGQVAIEPVSWSELQSGLVRHGGDR